MMLGAWWHLQSKLTRKDNSNVHLICTANVLMHSYKWLDQWIKKWLLASGNSLLSNLNSGISCRQSTYKQRASSFKKEFWDATTLRLLMDIPILLFITTHVVISQGLSSICIEPYLSLKSQLEKTTLILQLFILILVWCIRTLSIIRLQLTASWRHFTET